MSPRILFVEDDLELAKLIGEFLTRNGFLIHHIDRGDTVEAAIAEHDPDLLLEKYKTLLGEIQETENQLKSELAAALAHHFSPEADA